MPELRASDDGCTAAWPARVGSVLEPLFRRHAHEAEIMQTSDSSLDKRHFCLRNYDSSQVIWVTVPCFRVRVRGGSCVMLGIKGTEPGNRP